MSEDFTVIQVGKEYTMFNNARVKDVDSAMVFEALPENSGYAINIYLSKMTKVEAELIASSSISVRIMKDTPSLILPVIRFGNSPLVFELIHDATLYADDRSFQLAMDNTMVTIVGVDSVTNIVKALRMASMPRRLREMLLTAWTLASEDKGYSAKYRRWIDDISSRYPLEVLWERSVYVGKFGES